MYNICLFTSSRGQPHLFLFMNHRMGIVVEPMNQATLSSSPAPSKHLTRYNLIYVPVYSHFHKHIKYT